MLPQRQHTDTRMHTHARTPHTQAHTHITLKVRKKSLDDLSTDLQKWLRQLGNLWDSSHTQTHVYNTHIRTQTHTRTHTHTHTHLPNLCRHMVLNLCMRITEGLLDNTYLQ